MAKKNGNRGSVVELIQNLHGLGRTGARKASEIPKEADDYGDLDF